MNSAPSTISRRCGWLLPCLVLLGCTRAPDPATQASDAQLQWQGVLGCADCDGIRTQLRLARSGTRRDYTLVETYLARDGDRRFTDSGRWQRDQGLLRLRGDHGDMRVYALVAGGRLELRDAHGLPLAGHEDDGLEPVAHSEAP